MKRILIAAVASLLAASRASAAKRGYPFRRANQKIRPANLKNQPDLSHLRQRPQRSVWR
jgi:hypothetical protein